MQKELKIGFDFDNTIVCYDQVFYEIALEQGHIPESLPTTKNHVRDYLRQAGKEPIWTELQGYVYGCCMDRAKPFPNVFETFNTLIEQGIEFVIISHKTKYPFIGPQYDLHAAARGWIDQQGFIPDQENSANGKIVFLNETLEEKLACIAQQQCTHFIDDLPELLEETDFPSAVIPILFDPNQKFSDKQHLNPVHHWQELLPRITPKN